MSSMEQIFQFVLSLQDEYGFLIDVERLKMCLSSINDITDLEEVLYRLQSLVCCSEEQVSDFRSLFGQRFLGEHIRKLAKEDSGGNRSSKTLHNEYDTKLKAIESLEEQLSKSKDAEDEIKNKKCEVHDELLSLMEQEEKVQKTLGDWIKMNSYNLVQNARKNVRLQRRLNRLETVMDNLDYGDYEIRGLEQFECGEQLKTSEDLISFISIRLHQPNRLMYGLLELETIEKQLVDLVMNSDPITNPYGLPYLIDVSNLVNEFVELWKAALGPEKLHELRTLFELRDSLPKKIQRKKAEKTALSCKLQEQWAETARISELLRQKTFEAQFIESSIKQLEAENTVIKEASVNHRPIFTAENNRAVQTTAEMKEILDVSLQNMSAQQQAAILSYIRTNARIFRQTLRRKSAVPIRRQIDVRRTIRLAARTDGEPVRIRYKAPRKSHARVVCLVDISGSCRAAAELSLYFMAMMDDAFPGSCKKFAFVNHLVSVDKYFQNQSAVEGIQTVSSSVPSRGVYSNYGRTIHELREEYEPLFHKDTTVIIFGDARNNRNGTAEKDLKFIADRVRKVFWLNPDDVQKWGQGDSIIYQYQRAGAEVFHVSTAGELLGFLTEANMRV